MKWKIILIFLLGHSLIYAQEDIAGGNTPLSGFLNCTLPTASLNENEGKTRCVGTSISFTLSLTGRGPWRIKIKKSIKEQGTPTPFISFFTVLSVTESYNVIDTLKVRSQGYTITYMIDSVYDAFASDRGPIQFVQFQGLPLPSLLVSDTLKEVCLNDKYTLTASSDAGAVIRWNGIVGSGTHTNIAQNSFDLMVSSLGVNSCVLTKKTRIQVYAPPTLSITGNTTVCFRDTVNLFASGGIGYIWTSTSGQIGSSPNFSFVPVSSTKVRLMGTSSKGCFGKDSIDIVVRRLPTVSVTPQSAVICMDSTLLVSGISPDAVSYKWTTGSISSSVSYLPSGPGNTAFTLSVTDVFGCKGVAQSLVSVLDVTKPEVNILVKGINISSIDGTRQAKLGNASSPATNYTWWWGDPGEYRFSVIGVDTVISYKSTVQKRYISLTASNQCGVTQKTQELKFITNDVPEMLLQKLGIPNPAIQPISLNQPVVLIDLFGRNFGEVQTIDGLPSGVYIVFYQGESYKLLVQ